MDTIKNTWDQLRRYPSAIAGLIIIAFLIITAGYAIATIPYDEAIRLWRGGEEIWYKNPKFAPPEWTNLFSSKKQPVSFSASTANGTMTKHTSALAQDNTSTIDIGYTFDFAADGFPQEMVLYYTSKFVTKAPFVSVSWITPDGRTIKIANTGLEQKLTYRFTQDSKLQNLLGPDVMEGLFADPASNKPVPLKGKYQLLISGTTFEKGSDIDAEFVFQGQVYGLAGTDQARRDLMVPLLWGTPIALAFGIFASLATLLLTLIIATVGSWYGGWVDELIQRITEINLVLPFLSILIMIATFFNRSIWVILGATVMLSIFTGSIKQYRAQLLQLKESMYIEAARAYGASDRRIIFQYLIPRMIPLLIPLLVSSVPAFVFLEASLALLGLGDPVLPTWGKIINDAETNGALYKGYYYWIMEPAALLMFTGLGFAMLGFALDRIFNPRLRDM
jgi:peptide/nickel transport system permease protein